MQGQDRGYTFYAHHEPDSNTVTVVCFNNNAGEPTDGGLLHVQLRIEAYS